MEHYCEVHGCKFFENQGKDGKPNWWSHKVQGTNPAQYCNEKKKKEQPVAPPFVPPPARVVPTDEEIESELAKLRDELNTRMMGKKGNPEIPVVGKSFVGKPFSLVDINGKEPRTTRDQSIDEAVAIKAIVELACGKVIEPTHPLVRAVRDWCSDKLKNYISPVKEQPARDKSVDQKMLYSLIKSHLKFTSDKAVENWLENVAKVDMSRVESEPDKVFTEIESKQGWDK